MIDQLLTLQAQHQPNTARETRDLSSVITPAALPPTAITITIIFLMSQDSKQSEQVYTAQ